MSPQEALLEWYDKNKRDLPWRATRDPYRILLSEIMLQQTRVETVKAYYRRFLLLFPTVEALAAAPEEQVLKAWEGLGYYSRARNLQRAARMVAEDFHGAFPQSYEALLKLPGVGPYTAGAVASIAFGIRAPAVDGNVYRVASRFFGVREDVGNPAVQKAIREKIEASMPSRRAGDYNQALMELGATLCAPASPKCESCPWEARCDACAEGDAETLPVHEKKKPQRVVEMAVCLLFENGRVLVRQREENMLKGLFVFQLIEEETRPHVVKELLEQQGLPCAFEKELGTARHVFTHRIWNMVLLGYRLESQPDAETLRALRGRMVTPDELAALPMPAAMRAAREACARLL